MLYTLEPKCLLLVPQYFLSLNKVLIGGGGGGGRGGKKYGGMIIMWFFVLRPIKHLRYFIYWCYLPSNIKPFASNLFRGSGLSES